MTRRMQTALRLLAALGAFGAPALFAQMVLVQSAEAQSYPAQGYSAQPQPASSLPPPPYASANQPARYGGQQGYDRYGGGAPHPFVATQAGAPAYVGPRLSWSGKADMAEAGPRSAMGPTAYAQPAPSSQAVERGWTLMPPVAPAPSAASRLSSIYDPPPPPATAANPAQPAQADNGTTRRYSVHRDYGMEPTPIPIPPQFFGATADLTQPETADPARRTVTADGKSHNALQPTDGQ